MPGGNAKPEPRNRLLALLSKPVEERIIADCEFLHLGLRHVLYEPNKPMSSVYFPLDGIVSMVATMEDSTEIEVATTGNEGMVGLPLFLELNRRR